MGKGLRARYFPADSWSGGGTGSFLLMMMVAVRMVGTVGMLVRVTRMRVLLVTVNGPAGGVVMDMLTGKDRTKGSPRKVRKQKRGCCSPENHRL